MAHSHYTLKWVLFPPKLPLLMEGSGPHLIHGSLGLPEPSTQIASRSVQLLLQGSLLRQTDRPSYSVGNNRFIYVHSTAMWRNNNICKESNRAAIIFFWWTDNQVKLNLRGLSHMKVYCPSTNQAWHTAIWWLHYVLPQNKIAICTPINILNS